jgi:hypothetical protein
MFGKACAMLRAHRNLRRCAAPAAMADPRPADEDALKAQDLSLRHPGGPVGLVIGFIAIMARRLHPVPLMIYLLRADLDRDRQSMVLRSSPCCGHHAVCGHQSPVSTPCRR